MKTFAGFCFATLFLVSASSAFAVCSSPPTANTDVYNMAKNTTLNIFDADLALNDTDPDAGDSLTSYVSGYPSSGSWCGVAPGGWCYQPPTNFTGLVAIPYTVQDTCNNTDGGTILIYVQ
ncbi:MAG TPA: Ig-like domain-containing protein [Thermoanaerobaculia bacterium]